MAKFQLNIGDNIKESLLFWLTRYLIYKATTLNNSKADKEALQKKIRNKMGESMKCTSLNIKMQRARKTYKCYECGTKIKAGELYSRQNRGVKEQSIGWYKNRLIGVKKPVCYKCTIEGKNTVPIVKSDEEYYKNRVKFGVHRGKKWTEIDQDYLEWAYANLQEHQYYDEIEKEYLRRKNEKRT